MLGRRSRIKAIKIRGPLIRRRSLPHFCSRFSLFSYPKIPLLIHLSYISPFSVDLPSLACLPLYFNFKLIFFYFILSFLLPGRLFTLFFIPIPSFSLLLSNRRGCIMKAYRTTLLSFNCYDQHLRKFIHQSLHFHSSLHSLKF